MFQPELSLIPQADGSFTLLVKALVPTSCYSAGEITDRRDGISIPEALAFNFEIVHRPGICLQEVHYVSAARSGLRPGAGHNLIVVFSVVDGNEAGQAVVSFPQVEALQRAATRPVPGCSIIPDSVSAVVTSGPIGPAKLTVSSLVATPTPGYKARLVPAQPQGFNPEILLLDLEIERPSTPQPQVLATTPARYENKPYQGSYSDVTLRNGDQSVTVPVLVIFSAFEASGRYDFSASHAGH